MAGAYKWRLLSECDINDPFFDSLKYDYPEFENWYLKKAREEKQAFILYKLIYNYFKMLPTMYQNGAVILIILDNSLSDFCFRKIINFSALFNRRISPRRYRTAVRVS